MVKSPIKVVIKEPGKPAYYDEIPNELEILQKYVDGCIETVTIAANLVIICNEEGRRQLLPHNCAICGVDFCGTIVLAGVDGDEFCDIPQIMQDERELRVRIPQLFKEQPTRTCPICKREYSAPPAISRRNKALICPECGQNEALEAFWTFAQKRKEAARHGEG